MSASADAVHARWSTFLSKVSTRLDEVVAEANEGLAGLVETEVLDPGPLTNALTELKARMLALERKVTDAWDKTISPELDRVDADETTLSVLRREGTALKQKIGEAFEALEVTWSANAARALYELVKPELAAQNGGGRCASCGAPLTPSLLVQPVNVTCTHCKAINTVRPGLATAMYYQGGALHALAREAAKGEAKALAVAEARFKAISHPTEQDAAAWKAALTTYWAVYVKAKGALTPGWHSRELERDVAVKVSQAWAWVEREAAAFKRNSTALALASSGNAAGLAAFLDGEGRNHRVSVDEVLLLTCEHRDAKAFETALAVAYAREGGDEPRAAWVAEKRRETSLTISRRRG